MTDTHLWATLRARDAAAEIDFLIAAFGFVELVRYPDEDGGIAHAELAWPAGGGVMVGTARGSDDNPWPVRPGTAATYLHSPDTATLYEQAKAAGAQVLRPLADSDHGSREFTVRDPEANLWSVGTYAGHAGG